VIAFGGRILEGDGPKYLNTPETELYEKSKTLYGIETARPAIQRTKRAIVVEGYFDVLSLQQAGIEETVATCGTALTADHLERLRKLAEDLYVVLDADAAGSRAADGIVSAAVHTGLRTWRVQVPGAKDPDELVRTEGPDAMRRAIEGRESLVDWVIDWRIGQRGDGSQTRQQILEELLPVLAGLPATAISRAASRLRMPEEAIHEALGAFRRRPRTAPVEGETPTEVSWAPKRELVHLVWLLVHRHARIGALVQKLRPGWLDPHAPLRHAVARLILGEPVAAVQATIEDPGVHRLLSKVAARADLYPDDDVAVRVAFAEIVEGLLAPRRQARMDHLTATLDALSRSDPAAMTAAVIERTRLGKQNKDAANTLRGGDVDGWARLLDVEPLSK
jgi:DNA primase